SRESAPALIAIALRRATRQVAGTLLDSLPEAWVIVMSDQEPQLEMTEADRREFLRAVLGVGLAGGAAVGGWGALEFLVPQGSADSWHKSVCRFCGTGCGIRVGMRDGKISDVRGDDHAHNRGVICVKGTMLRALPLLPGRLLKPKIRKGDRMVE